MYLKMITYLPTPQMTHCVPICKEMTVIIVTVFTAQDLNAHGKKLLLVPAVLGKLSAGLGKVHRKGSSLVLGSHIMVPLFWHQV